jgi:glutamyl-tRNA synthetase
MPPVRVRFAPSPTGYLHVGGARTALFNWLYAQQQGGQFVLRMEDTDAARNTDAARRTIFDGLHWLGLDPHEGPEQGGPVGPYSQSERQETYARAIVDLKASGVLYPCFCSKERLSKLRLSQEAAREPFRYDRHCRALSAEEVARKTAAGEVPAWRLRVPEGETVLDDLIRGVITVNHADVEDIILVRGDGTPIYNLAVVIDDHTMGITHVLRGEDHLTNCFKQIIIFRAMGWPVPRYGHLPLILGPAGEGKLSKRKHPEAALEHYIARDFHPEAFINWLALIGWSFDDKTEIMTRAELIERFSIERVNKSGARLNMDKLAHISGDYIRREPAEVVLAKVREHLLRAGLVKAPLDAATEALVAAIAAAEHERLRGYADIVELARWVFADPLVMEEKAQKNLTKESGTAALLRDWAATLSDPLPPAVELEALARGFCEARGTGFGKFVHPVRAALTGRTAGPPLFDCVRILGAARARARLETAAQTAS